MNKTSRAIIRLSQDKDQATKALYLACRYQMRTCLDIADRTCPVKHKACMSTTPTRKDCAQRLVRHFMGRAKRMK